MTDEGRRGGDPGGQKFLLAVQALFVLIIVVTSRFNQLQCDVPGEEGVGDLAGRRRWRMGFGSKRILWLALQRQGESGDSTAGSGRGGGI